MNKKELQLQAEYRLAQTYLYVERNKVKYQEQLAILRKAEHPGSDFLMAYDYYFGIFQTRNKTLALECLLRGNVSEYTPAVFFYAREVLTCHYEYSPKLVQSAFHGVISLSELFPIAAYTTGLAYFDGKGPTERNVQLARIHMDNAVKMDCKLAKLYRAVNLTGDERQKYLEEALRPYPPLFESPLSTNNEIVDIQAFTEQLSQLDNLISLSRDKNYWAMRVLTQRYEVGVLEKEKTEAAIIQVCEILNTAIKEALTEEVYEYIQFIVNKIFSITLNRQRINKEHNTQIALLSAKLISFFVRKTGNEDIESRINLALGQGFGVGFKENKENATERLIKLANTSHPKAQLALADWQLVQGNYAHGITLLQTFMNGNIQDNRLPAYQKVLEEHQDDKKLLYRAAQNALFGIGCPIDVSQFHVAIMKLIALEDPYANYLLAFAIYNQLVQEKHENGLSTFLKNTAALGYVPAKILLAEYLLKNPESLKKNQADLNLAVSILTELKEKSPIIKFLCVNASTDGILNLSKEECQLLLNQSIKEGYTYAQYRSGCGKLFTYQENFVKNNKKNDQLKTEGITLMQQSMAYRNVFNDNAILSCNEKLDEYMLMYRHYSTIFNGLLTIGETLYHTGDHKEATKYLQEAILHDYVTQENKNKAQKLLDNIKKIQILSVLIEKQIEALRAKHPGKLPKIDFEIDCKTEANVFSLKIKLLKKNSEKSPAILKKIQLPAPGRIHLDDDYISIEKINMSCYVKNLDAIHELLRVVTDNTKNRNNKGKSGNFSDDAHIQSLTPEKDKYDEMVKKYQRNLDKLHRLDAAVLEHYQDIRELKEHMSNTMMKKNPFSFINVISQENEKIHKAIKLFEGITTKVYPYSGSDVNQDFSLKLKEIEEAYHLSHAGYIAISAVVNSFILEREFNKLKKNFIQAQEEKPKNSEVEPIEQAITAPVKEKKKRKRKRKNSNNQESNELTREVKTEPKDNKSKLLKLQEKLCAGDPIAIADVSKILISDKKALEYFPLYEDFERIYLVREDKEETAKQSAILGLTIKKYEIKYQIRKFIKNLPDVNNENSEPTPDSYQCKR